MTRVAHFSLDNKFLIMLGALLLAGAGVAALTRLPVDAVPDVTNTQVQVMTTAPALSPLETEQFITAPVEAAIAGIPDVTEVRSVSQFGLSVVTVVFAEGTDIYWARQQVAERVGDAREMIPAGIPEPKLGPIATGLGEIYQFEVRNKPGYNHSLMFLRETLDWQIARQLRLVPGVVEVNTNGGEARCYEVRPDPVRLAEFDISLSKLYAALESNNANGGGGYLVEKNGEQRVVRAEGLLRGAADLKNVVLDTRGGTPVLLGQVAAVEAAPLLRQGALTRDGKGEGVLGIVMLLAGENAREVVARVKERVAEIDSTLPEGVEIDVVYDRTDLVKLTVRTLAKNLAEGGALVVIVLLVMLGSVRAGLIVALAVPLSMLGAFVGMVLANLSGNLMSLGAIDFGLIVDGSVVLIEHVVRKVAESRRETGQKRADESVVRAACGEVVRPVVFGVGIILLVYLPILSLRGVEGKMFRPMALTVIFALLTSLALALTLMPVLAAIFLRAASEKEPVLVRLAGRIYQPLLRAALAAPHAVVLAALAAVLVSGVVATRLGAVFIPRLDEGAVAMQVSRLPGVSLDTTVAMTTQLERVLMGFPEVKSVITKSGRPEIANDPMPVSLSDVIVTLNPEETWRFGTKDELVAAMETALAEGAPGQVINYGQPIEMRVAELVAGVRSDVAVSIYGDDLETLRDRAQAVARSLRTVEGAQDIAVEQTGGLPYLRLVVDRDATARYGVTVDSVLKTIDAVGGRHVGRVYEGQRHFPVVVRLQPGDRADANRLMQLKVEDAAGRPVPLAALVTAVSEDGPAQISRDRARRRTIVQVNVRGRDLAGFVAAAQAAVERDVPLPPGYTLRWGGTFENLQQATARLSIAVPVSLVMIFVLLQSAFNSARLALLIYLNVPVAATGGVILLWLRDMPLSISAGVGFIALFGVAVLNGVVLVTSIVDLRKSGASAGDAARQGAEGRLRPVLMTAMVATLGFVPMAFSTAAGAEVQRPLATVVIGGLVTATALTLLVIPAVYHWFAGDVSADDPSRE